PAPGGPYTAPSRQVTYCVEGAGRVGRYSRDDDARRVDVVRRDRRTAQGATGSLPRRAPGRAAPVPGRDDRGGGPAAPGPVGDDAARPGQARDLRGAGVVRRGRHRTPAAGDGPAVERRRRLRP